MVLVIGLLTILKFLPPKKTVNRDRVFRNETVIYYLTVENIGYESYTENLTVIDSLPSGVEYIETIGIINADVLSNATLSNNNKTITWVITNIPKGATAIITVLARATEVGTQVNNETIIYPDGHNQTVNCTIEVKVLMWLLLRLLIIQIISLMILLFGLLL